MEKMIIDERTGWEYELKGGYYFPTGRVMRNGALTPSEQPDDNDPGEEKPIGTARLRLPTLSDILAWASTQPSWCRRKCH